MKRETKWIVFACLLILVVLWFTDVLPLQAAKAVAEGYMAKQEDGRQYTLVDAEYSPAHDCYFVYFMEKKSGFPKQRNVGVLYRYFPFFPAFDSAYPG